MEIIDPSLGMFSLLPAELRVKIWKFLSPQLYIGRSLPKNPDYLSGDQAILLASRKIYAEVAAEVPSGYNGNNIAIFVSPEYEYKWWIEARNLKGVKWTLEDIPDASSRGFCDLPWHNLNVQIWIWAPHRSDRGQVLCLYQKTRDLVEMLKGVKEFLNLRIFFADTETSSWFDDGQPQRSIDAQLGLLHRTQLLGPKCDYEFILPLFLQIRNVKQVGIYSTAILDGKVEDMITGGKFQMVEWSMMETVPYCSRTTQDYYYGQRIGMGLDQLSMLVEYLLDFLPSKTANMLRLARFSSWYTDKLHGNSPYEIKLKELLRRVDVEHSDLEITNRRYRIMRSHNPLSLAYRSAFPWTLNWDMHLGIDASGWDQDAWHYVYRDGIPPLNSKETELRYRKWSMEYDAPENGPEFVKLYQYFYLIRG
jgi:hypothetical protein